MKDSYSSRFSYVQILLGAAFLVLSTIGFSQSGPGGVGTSSNNVIWLDASTLSLADGADVSSWVDISGNSVSFGASADAGSSFPDYLLDGGAGFPVLDFNDGNEERLIINPFSNMPSTAITTIMVFATANASEGIVSYSAVAGGGGNNEYLFFDASSLRTYVGDINNAGGSFNDGLTTYNILGSTWQSAGGNLTHYKNGTSVNTATIANGDAMVNGGVLSIGGEQDGDDSGYDAAQDFGGRIAEIIMYNTLATAAERLVIENYLSAKYGITIATDLYSFASATYNNNVIGIGNDGATSHLTSSGSGGGLYLTGSGGTGTTVFDANEWLFAGHDGASSSAPTLADLPAGLLKRLPRIWAFDETAPTDSYDVTVTFDLDELGLAGASNYTLLKRTGTTGNFTDLLLTPSVLGSDVSFTLLNADIEDAYFTLGFEATASPGGVDTNLAMWLQANSDVSVSGSAVTDWLDQSGNGNDATDPSMLAELQSSTSNFNPGIVFDADATSLEGTVVTTNSDLTFFVAYQDNSAANSGGVLFDFDGTQSHSLSDNNYSGGSGLAANITKNSPALISIDHPNGTTTADIYQDGTQVELNYTTLGNSAADTYNYTLGDADAGGSAFSGTLNELLVYEGTLTPTLREQVSSFLAIKYGITLSHDYRRSDGTEIFDIDGATNDGYENQISVLASDFTSRLFQKVSKPLNDSLVIALEEDFTSSNDSRSTTLVDNSFFFASNNGGDFDVSTVSGNIRLNRIWKATESGTVGSVFLGVPTSIQTFDSLIVSTDPTFATGVTRVAVSTLGGYNSVSYDFTSGEYFTFTVDQILSSDNENLLVWLKADAGVTKTGSTLTLWGDQSGNGNDANNDDTEFDNEGALPSQDEDPVSFVQSGLNFNPSISSTGADRPITGSYTSTSAGATFFIVGKEEDVASNDHTWFDTFGAGGANNVANRTYFFENRYNEGGTFTQELIEDTTAIYTINHQTSATADIYESGVLFETAYSVSNTLTADTYHYVIGDDATGGNEFIGQIAEFMVFQGSLSQTERECINSYLAIKYGISLGHDYRTPEGASVFDIATIANDRFENNIVALGREDVLGLNQKIAKNDLGSLILSLEEDFENDNASRSTSLNTGQYFFASSNTGSIASDSSYRNFSGNRLGRKWKVNETNSPGAIYVAISDVVAANFNVLIVSSDSTFSTGVTEVTLSQNSGFYYANHDFADGEYFSFANSVSPGGVGDGLKLWLRADASVTESINLVSAWGDQSGIGNDGTSPENDPTLLPIGINFNPSIEFSTAGDRIQGSLITDTDDLSFLIVAEDRSGMSSGGVLFELDDTISPVASDELTLDDGSYAGITFSSEIVKDTAQVLSVVHPNGTGTTTIYDNGTSIGSNTPRAAEVTTYNYSLGDNLSSANGFDGLISEVIVYDETLSDTEREMLQSYLAVKYALPVRHNVTASDGSTVLNAATSAGYLDGFFGLAYDVRTQLDQKVAKSPYDSLRIATTDDFVTANTARATAFNDLEYIALTNNGGDFSLGSDYKAETNVRLNRVWKTHELNNPGQIVIALPDDINGVDMTVYNAINTILISSDPTFNSGVTEQSVTVSGTNKIITVDLTDGQYFTFTTAAPESSIWYSYLTGNWSDPANWTLDGALSALYLNPSNEIPSEGDTVVINSGRTITADINSILVERVDITGTIDLGSTGSHNFTYLLGSGNLRMSGNAGVDNYPAAEDSLFYDAAEGGTVEYYGTGLDLDTKRRYNDLIVNLDNASDEIVHVTDSIIVNGNMTISQGIFQFGDNSNSGDRVGEVQGDLLVEAIGGIEVGTTNSRHEFNLSGDFTNQGTVEFTNRGSANYAAEATDGIVDVNFASATQDQTVTLEGTTNFYRIEVNKGVDATYKVVLSATDPANFGLFGYASQGHGSVSQLTTNNNNIGLLYGTLELGSNIQVNELTTSGNYNVSEGAGLVVNGGDLRGSTWIVNYGTCTLSAGSIDMGIGTVIRNSGAWLVEGGTFDLGHFRTSGLGAGNDGSWTQTGGVVNVTGSGSQGTYYTFSLTYTTCSFTMSGGELNVQSNNSSATSGIFLNSAPENTTVSGGLVTVDMAHTDTDSVFISSTVPFYNLTVKQSAANANPEAIVIVEGGNSGGTAPDGVTLGRNKLEVFNDFIIDNTETNGTTLISDHSEIGITGSLTIANGATFSADSTILTFEGTGSSQISIQTGATFVLDTLVINKDLSTTSVDLLQGNATAIQVDSLFSLQTGIFDYGTFDIHIGKDLIVNDTVGTSAATGNFILNGSQAQTITSDDSGFIHDLTISNGNGVTLSGDLGVESLDLNTGIFDLNTSGLTLDNEAQTSGTFSSTLMIQTAGNASDGGVRSLFDADELITYPFGTSGKYTPVTVDVSLASSDDGYIQIALVDNVLATTATATDILDFYWRVGYSDFGTLPTINSYVFTYDQTDVGGTESNYVPGFVEDNEDADSDSDFFSRATDGTTADVDDAANNTITFDGGGSFTLQAANYTAAETAAFAGSVVAYYNRLNGTRNWDSASSWFLDAARTIGAADWPTAGDVAVITGNNFGDAVNVSGTQAAAELIFERTGTYTGIESMARLRFSPTDVLNVDRVSGVGDIYLQYNLTNSASLTADIGDFAANDTSVVLLYFTQNGTYTFDPGDFFTELPTLRLYGQLASFGREVTFNYDFNAANLVVDGEVSLLVGGNYTVAGQTELGFTGHGRIRFPNGTTSYTLTTTDLNTATDKNTADENLQAIEVISGNTNDIDHKLVVNGDFTLDFFDVEDVGNDFVNIDLYNSPNENNVILEFQGDGEHSFTNDFTAGQFNIDLYRVVMNKGSDTTNTMTISALATIDGDNTTSPQSIELQNGKLILDNSSNTWELANNSDFDIPSTAGLEVTSGTVTSTGANIILDGLLRVNGGTATLATSDIEYSSSGNALIDVSSGTLNVGGQVRRTTTATNGVLKYRQTGGDVDIATDGADDTNRAAFEVLNTGSEFTLTGGTFNIERGVTGDSNESLDLSPDTYNLAGSTINIFENLGANYGSNYFNISSTIPLNNLTIANSINLPDVRLYTQNLEVENITINTNQVLETNGFTFTVNGDFTNSGTYTNTSTETIFGGAGAQAISGAGTYTIFDLRKSGAGTATSSITLDVDNNLYLTSGTFDIGSNSLNLQNDAFIQSTLTNSGGAGLVFDGNTNQELSGLNNDVVDIGTITISNSSGVDIPDGNGFDFNITQELRLNGGVFNIGGSLITLEAGTPVTAVSPFNVGNMVQTNSSFTDNGLKIDFYTVAADTTVFFPIGELKYTPVQFELDAGTTAGGIRVRPANERHPTIIDDAEPGTVADPEIDDTQNVLQYHWIVVAETLTNATGTATYFYDHSDITNTQTDTIDFISARLLANDVTWDKFPPTLFLGASQSFEVPLSTATSAEITGDYTAGAGSSDGINADIEAAIPDQLAQYETSFAGAGNYSVAANWNVLNGPAITDGVGPVGAQIIVRNGDDLTLNLSNIRLYSTEIETGGILRVPTGVTGIRLGNVTGSGTIVLEDNELLPTGEYTDFLTCSGGAIQYSGTTTYGVLSGISQIRKVIFEGSGVRTMPNNALSICDTLQINGPTVALNSGLNYSIGDGDLDRFEIQAGAVTLSNGSTMDVTGDFLVSGGSFTGASGTSIEISDDLNFSGGTLDWNGSSVLLDGTSSQLIDGNFTGSAAFDDLSINNSNGTGVTINSGDIEVGGTLTLTDGLLNTSSTETLTLSSSGDWTGASSASYVTGPITKQDIAIASTYEFPVGKAARYAPAFVVNIGTGGDDWTAEYFTTTNPTYDNTVFDNTDPGSGFNALSFVRSNDLWTITSAASNTAQVRATYGAHDAFPGTNIRLVWWDDEAVLDGDVAQNRWENQGGQVVGTATAGTVTSENTVFFSTRHFGVGYAPASVLPVELIYFSGEALDNEVNLSWATATELNNDRFEIEHSLDGITFEKISEVAGNGTTSNEIEYAFTDSKPAFGVNYYRLKQVDYDGAFEYSNIVRIVNDFVRKEISVTTYPNPTTPENLNVRFESGDDHTAVSLKIVDLTGQVYYSKMIDGALGFDKAILPRQNMTPGIYFLIIVQGESVSKQKIVIR
ncbi:MAG: T9SS type A sorting domain-containing protein [Cyclobacteriaceae bacterium]